MSNENKSNYFIPVVTIDDLLNEPEFRSFYNKKAFLFAFKNNEILELNNVFTYENDNYLIQEIHEQNGDPDNWYLVHCQKVRRETPIQ